MIFYSKIYEPKKTEQTMNFWRGLVGTIFALSLPVFSALHVLGIITPSSSAASSVAFFHNQMNFVDVFYWGLFVLFFVGILMLNSEDKEVEKNQSQRTHDGGKPAG